MLRYPVKLSKDTNGTILVDVPDIPEAHSFPAKTGPRLPMRAVDAIETALMLYIEDRRDIPVPGVTHAHAAKTVTLLAALTDAKIGLYRATCARKRSAKRSWRGGSNCHLPQIDRLLDLAHDSRLDQLEAALAALGKRLTVAIEEAA